MPARTPKPELHPKDGRPILQFESREAFRDWLARNGGTSEGIWLKFAKKNSGVPSVVYDEALDVALCYGWIDSQLLSLDERFYLQRFTPRGPKSKWSQVNCRKVTELIARGEMSPGGMKQIDAAKADGRWDAAYAAQSEITVPDDFRKLLERHKRAAEFFKNLSKRHRFAILYRIQDAKKPETRQRRLETYLKMLKAGEKPT
jgi:uncharacterized protein YdeI (YjbR/CyaY-like superfamily)